MTLLETVEALRGDVSELRHEMQLGLARIDGRFAQLEWGVLPAAIIGLFGR